MFIVTVFVIHCWLCSSTNHNSARCHLPTAPSPAKCTQRHTIDYDALLCGWRAKADHREVNWLQVACGSQMYTRLSHYAIAVTATLSTKYNTGDEKTPVLFTSIHCVSKRTNFETVWLKIITIDFDDIGQKYPEYSRIEFACFSFYQLSSFKPLASNNANFDANGTREH